MSAPKEAIGRRAVLAAGIVACVVGWGGTLLAGPGSGQCPNCGAECRPIRDESTMKRHCWKVEWEHICIPPVRFPWQSCHEPLRCGRVKAVRKLKKHEYECPSCRIRWEVTVPPSCEKEPNP